MDILFTSCIQEIIYKSCRLHFENLLNKDPGFFPGGNIFYTSQFETLLYGTLSSVTMKDVLYNKGCS